MVPAAVPSVRVQVTARLSVAATVAVNCRLPSAVMVLVAGVKLTVTHCVLADTSMVAVADFVLSALLVATMWYLPATMGAVYFPLASIEPPVAPSLMLHVTPVLVEPVTAAAY